MWLVICLTHRGPTQIVPSGRTSLILGRERTTTRNHSRHPSRSDDPMRSHLPPLTVGVIPLSSLGSSAPTPAGSERDRPIGIAGDLLVADCRAQADPTATTNCIRNVGGRPQTTGRRVSGERDRATWPGLTMHIAAERSRAAFGPDDWNRRQAGVRQPRGLCNRARARRSSIAVSLYPVNG